MPGEVKCCHLRDFARVPLHILVKASNREWGMFKNIQISNPFSRMNIYLHILFRSINTLTEKNLRRIIFVRRKEFCAVYFKQYFI